MAVKTKNQFSKTPLEFSEKANIFLKDCIQQSKQLKRLDPNLNRPLNQLIKNTPPLPAKLVDDFFTDHHKYKVNEDVIKEVQLSLHKIRNIINSFTPEKRYYILETIDFFRNKSHIGSLLPALLTLKRNSQKRELLEFVYITFSTLNKNVETIISIPDLFKNSSIHVEQGSLYSFAVEISRIVIRLFHSEYIQGYKD